MVRALRSEDYYDILAANERILEESHRAQRRASQSPRHLQLQERYLQQANLRLIPAKFSAPVVHPSRTKSPSKALAASSSSSSSSSPTTAVSTPPPRAFSPDAQRPILPPGYGGGRPSRNRIARELTRADASLPSSCAAAALSATHALYRGPAAAFTTASAASARSRSPRTRHPVVSKGPAARVSASGSGSDSEQSSRGSSDSTASDLGISPGDSARYRVNSRRCSSGGGGSSRRKLYEDAWYGSSPSSSHGTSSSSHGSYGSDGSSDSPARRLEKHGVRVVQELVRMAKMVGSGSGGGGGGGGGGRGGSDGGASRSRSEGGGRRRGGESGRGSSGGGGAAAAAAVDGGRRSSGRRSSSGGGAGKARRYLVEPSPAFMRRWRAQRKKQTTKKQAVRFLLRSSGDGQTGGSDRGTGSPGSSGGRGAAAAAASPSPSSSPPGSGAGTPGGGVFIVYPGSSVVFPAQPLPYSLEEALEAVRKQQQQPPPPSQTQQQQETYQRQQQYEKQMLYESQQLQQQQQQLLQRQQVWAAPRESLQRGHQAMAVAMQGDLAAGDNGWTHHIHHLAAGQPQLQPHPQPQPQPDAPVAIWDWEAGVPVVPSAQRHLPPTPYRPPRAAPQPQPQHQNGLGPHAPAQQAPPRYLPLDTDPLQFCRAAASPTAAVPSPVAAPFPGASRVTAAVGQQDPDPRRVMWAQGQNGGGSGAAPYNCRGEDGVVYSLAPTRAGGGVGGRADLLPLGEGGNPWSGVARGGRSGGSGSGSGSAAGCVNGKLVETPPRPPVTPQPERPLPDSSLSPVPLTSDAGGGRSHATADPHSFLATAGTPHFRPFSPSGSEESQGRSRRVPPPPPVELPGTGPTHGSADTSPLPSPSSTPAPLTGAQLEAAAAFPEDPRGSQDGQSSSVGGISGGPSFGPWTGEQGGGAAASGGGSPSVGSGTGGSVASLQSLRHQQSAISRDVQALMQRLADMKGKLGQ